MTLAPLAASELIHEIGEAPLASQLLADHAALKFGVRLGAAKPGLTIKGKKFDRVVGNQNGFAVQDQHGPTIVQSIAANQGDN